MLGANLSQCGRAFGEEIVAIANRGGGGIVADKQKKSNLYHRPGLELSIQSLKSIRRGANCQKLSSAKSMTDRDV